MHLPQTIKKIGLFTASIYFGLIEILDCMQGNKIQ